MPIRMTSSRICSPTHSFWDPCAYTWYTVSGRPLIQHVWFKRLLKMFRVASSLRLVRGVRQRAVHSTSLSTTAARRAEAGSNDNKKIYELRTYAIRPDKFGEYLKLMEENIDLRTAHSKLLGFWITELGGINEVNHLWEYGTGPHISIPILEY